MKSPDTEAWAAIDPMARPTPWYTRATRFGWAVVDAKGISVAWGLSRHDAEMIARAPVRQGTTDAQDWEEDAIGYDRDGERSL